MVDAKKGASGKNVGAIASRIGSLCVEFLVMEIHLAIFTLGETATIKRMVFSQVR